MRATTRGKRRRADVAWFLFNADAELGRLQRTLADGTWRPASFELLQIRDPKPRAIAVAPVADRVVHAAVGRLLEEVWGPRLLPCDMACRKGYGTHRARLALQRSSRSHRFCVHLDIATYFPSIAPDIVRTVLGRRIRDAAFLEVLDRILVAGTGLIDRHGMRTFLGVPDDWPPPGRGLPIGAYTSQVIATHVLLCDLDHFVKRTLKVPGYVRYVDDLFLFGDRRADLRRWRREVGAWLARERELRLKHPDARVLSCAGTLDALGARITREQIAPGPRSLRRLSNRVRVFARRRRGGGGERFERSVIAAVGGMLG